MSFHLNLHFFRAINHDLFSHHFCKPQFLGSYFSVKNVSIEEAHIWILLKEHLKKWKISGICCVCVMQSTRVLAPAYFIVLSSWILIYLHKIVIASKKCANLNFNPWIIESLFTYTNQSWTCFDIVKVIISWKE